MRKTFLAAGVALAALALAAAPVLAQAAPSDTAKLIVANGAVYDIMGMPYDLTYKADGTYTQNGGPGGTYKVDGKKMCHTPTEVGQEACADVPDGKKSGDTFEITSELFGPMKVKIK